MSDTKTRRRIVDFRRQFGDPHYFLALHAAFPLALTPDWLYRCWASFPADVHGNALQIPWIAVADVLLSGFCREVGFELYQMDAEAQVELLQALQTEPRLGPRRIVELNAFTREYYRADLENSNAAPQDYASNQTQFAHCIAIAKLKPDINGERLGDLEAVARLNPGVWMRLAGFEDRQRPQESVATRHEPMPTQEDPVASSEVTEMVDEEIPQNMIFPQTDAGRHIRPTTLFIGLGGTGDWVLTYLKEKVRAIYGEIPPQIQFRLLDTLAPDQRNNTAARLGMAVGITRSEYLQLADQPPGNFYNIARQVAVQPSSNPPIARWFKADLFTQHLAQADFNLVRGAGRHRQFGRMRMFLNKQQVLNMLQKTLQGAGYPNSGETAIWIIGSVAGGTGAGIFSDMALLARKAAQSAGGHPHRILGVAVLPSIFEDVINPLQHNYSYDVARAFAVMREIARFQAPVNPSDWGRDAISRTDMRFLVEYDQATRVLQQSRLFDSLVFYDHACSNEEERRSYYSQIADGLSLMLDSAVGNKLFASWINAEEDYATALNSHRIFLPARLYEHLFLGEAILQLIDGILPLESNGAPKAGSMDDRRQDASELLEKQTGPLFNRLMLAKEKSHFERLKADIQRPQFIVDDLLGFNNAELVYGTEATAAVVEHAKKLYRTLSEGLSKFGDPGNIDFFAMSKDYAVSSITRRRQTYEGDGNNSFSDGLRTLRPIVSKRIQAYIDEAMKTALIKHSVTDQGLARLAITCSEMVKGLNQCRDIAQQLGGDDRARSQRLQQDETDAKQSMETCKKTLFGKGELPRKQQAYFDAADAVQAQWQKIRLLQWLEELIISAQDRLDFWQEKAREWQKALEDLRLGINNTVGDIHAELERQTLSIQSSSLGISNRPDMDGYREILRERCLVDPQTGLSLTPKLLGMLEWKYDAASGLRLSGWPGRDAGLSPRELESLLRDALTGPIAENMRRHEGMAKYLEWLRDRNPVFLTELVQRLLRATTGLADRQPTTPTRQFLLLHGDQWNPQINVGEDMFEKIFWQIMIDNNISQRGLQRNLRDADGRVLFKDKNIIALLVTDNRIEYQTIPVMAMMRSHYASIRSQDQSQLPWHTQAFHLFRCEQEAFEIERRQCRQTGQTDWPLLAGEYYRVLDEPERVKLFVQGLAVGLVRQIETGIDQREWVIGPLDSATFVWLTEGGGDLFRALVTFVQDKKDRRANFVADLPLAKVKEWIEKAAAGKPWSEWAREFRETQREGWLRMPAVSGGRYTDERQSFLALILDYYLDGN